MDSLFTSEIRNIPDADYIIGNNCFIAHVSNMDCERDELIKYPRNIDDYLFVLCVQGEVCFSAGPEVVRLTAGVAYLSWQSNIYQILSHRDLEVYMLLVNDKFINELNMDMYAINSMNLYLSHHPLITFPEQKLTFCLTAYEMIKNEYLSDNIFKEKTTSNLFRFFAYHVFNIVYQNMEQEQITTVASSRQSRYFDEFMRLLHDNVKKERSIKFYADKLFISPKHLSQTISSVTKKSARTYIDDMIILEIKNMLKYADSDIKEIAYELNFKNPSFFAKFFKRKTGMTPKEYRVSI